MGSHGQTPSVAVLLDTDTETHLSIRRGDPGQGGASSRRGSSRGGFVEDLLGYPPVMTNRYSELENMAIENIEIVSVSHE
jgi:hypothetical protein